jgi:hypothetical protein
MSQISPVNISPVKLDTDREPKEGTPLRESELKIFGTKNSKVNDDEDFGINGN